MAIDYVNVALSQSAIGVRFDQNVKVDSLSADKFSLYRDGATPVEIANAFREITTCDDFNSLRRILVLYPNVDLDAGADYILVTSGIEYAGRGVGDDDSFPFTIQTAIISAGEPDPEPIFIEDHSIKSTSLISFSEIDEAPVSEFYIVTTDPESGDFYVETDYENGRFKIVFSSNPDTDYINADYIKVQRKKNQTAPSRWETIPVRFSIASDEPWVYLSFPAIEDDTMYREDGYTYFEENYTYRIKLSSYIKAA